ncbi:hypothetical protein H0A71_20260 [Alcaligenaceae bacterium]|nr:hypothetical protein [Alcaligenaceae bacterium]
MAAYTVKADGTIIYKFWDKNSALEKAARHLGLYETDNRQRADALGDLLESLSGNVKGVSTGADETSTDTIGVGRSSDSD